MSAIDELLANNRAFAESLPAGHVDVRPSRRLTIVTCMDSRLDVFAALGLGHGEAHVLRNAGGIITDDVLRSLALSQERLGTREVMLIHHTNCGMDFPDLDAAVREAIGRVRQADAVPHRETVRGFVYDVETHALREVSPE
jgi:carbonic anhydrase